MKYTSSLAFSQRICIFVYILYKSENTPLKCQEFIENTGSAGG